jgi:hypothetical protein
MSSIPTPPSSVRRLAVLLAVILGVLSLAFMLPRSEVAREAAVRMELPESLTFWTRDAEGINTFQYWHGAPMPVSEEEHRMLAPDTEFAKKRYYLSDVDTKQPLISDPRLATFADLLAVQASIVLSGHDLNDSIHRPERCLPAQGFKELQLEPRILKTDRGDVPVTRIRCYTEIKDPATGDFVVDAAGHPLRLQHVFYYWFIGSHTVTSDHYHRTLTDMRDRLFGGFDQRWAYVLLGSSFTDYLFDAATATAPGAGTVVRTEEQTDALLGQVVAGISRSSLDWDRIRP